MTRIAGSALAGILALAAVPALAAPPAGVRFVDPLDAPARPSPLAERALLTDVAAAGPALVAVGARGHILRSEDGGVTWTQVPVPVGADLTAVFFASAERGWAVGHGGVVLATADGGRTWVKQLDARALVPLLERHCAAGGCGSELARQIEMFTREGADTSFLDVWFADERRGFAVGAFNLAVHTEDGGATWQPWLDRFENPAARHLYAIGRVAGEVWVAGEAGLLLKLDPAARRFRPAARAGPGSLFGLTGTGSAVIAHGLRGKAYRSRDGGRSWEELRTGLDASLNGSAELPGGSIVLVSHGGDVLVSADGGETFRTAIRGAGAPISAVAPAGAGAVVLVGPGGVRRAALRE